MSLHGVPVVQSFAFSGTFNVIEYRTSTHVAYPVVESEALERVCDSIQRCLRARGSDAIDARHELDLALADLNKIRNKGKER